MRETLYFIVTNTNHGLELVRSQDLIIVFQTKNAADKFVASHKNTMAVEKQLSFNPLLALVEKGKNL